MAGHRSFAALRMTTRGEGWARRDGEDDGGIRMTSLGPWCGASYDLARSFVGPSPERSRMDQDDHVERDFWLKQGPPGWLTCRRGRWTFYIVPVARWLSFHESEMNKNVGCRMIGMARRRESGSIIQTIFVCIHPESLRNALRCLPRLLKECPREEDYGWGW